MKSVAQAALALLAALVLGWWWFAPAAPTAAPSARAQPLAASVPSRSAPARPSRAQLPRPPTTRISAESDDDRLETLMLEHHDAHNALVDAYDDAMFRADGVLATCNQHRSALCWLRFHATLRGAALTLHLDATECRVDEAGAAGRGSAAAGPRGVVDNVPDDALTECVTAHATPAAPLTLPSAAADDLRPYDGPLEIPLQWSPL